MADRARHAFGSLANVPSALDSGAIDAFDILFLDGDSNPKVGWVDKNGVVRLVKNECVVAVDGDSLPTVGETGKVYIFGDEGYFWNGSEFKPFAKSADLSSLETQVSELEAQMDQKVDAATVQSMIESNAESAIEVVEF